MSRSLKKAMVEYKQVILVRSDLKLPKGKMSAQCAHASVECVLKLLKKDKDTVDAWRKFGMKKVVLKVSGEKELYAYMQKAKDAGLITGLITDAGHTVVEPGTVTCCGIGPGDEEGIDSVVSGLQLM